MNRQSHAAIERYVKVLDQRAQAAQVQLANKESQLHRAKAQLERLDQTAREAQLKKTAGNVALYANAAGFRSEVWSMAEQMRDAHNVLALECRQVQQLVYTTMQQHGSIESVLKKARAVQASEQGRQGQRATDELASQSWCRQQRLDLAGNPISRDSRA